MNSISQDARPLVADAPRFNYTGNENIRLLYRMPGYGNSDFIEVIGDPDNGAYEWVVRDDDGKIVKNSDSGYGCTLAALRDGLLAYDGYISTSGIQVLEHTVRLIVEADDRAGLATAVRKKIENQGGECDDADSWLLNALDKARKVVARLNAKKSLFS